MSALALTATLAPAARATTHLAGQLPSLPNSCNTCHTSGPGSDRNVFGQQVESNLMGDASSGTLDWASVCLLDADSDGATNGAELGDPCCTFSVGDDAPAFPTSSPADAAATTDNVCGDEPVDVPAGWSCPARNFGSDDGCDCGCGVLDTDCASAAYASCEHNGCPGAASGAVVDVTDTTACLDDAADSTWTCEGATYGDGAVCDCGCGILDADCESGGFDACDASGCPVGTLVDDADPTTCLPSEAFEGARPGWTCPTAWYAADDGCDCGCGIFDPDCPRTPTLSDCAGHGCDLADSGNGASPLPTDVTQCSDTDPPEGWTCPSAWYGAGFRCDCGCGAPDPDCADPAYAFCELSGCAEGTVVDEADPTLCVDAPSCASTSGEPVLPLLLAALLLLALRPLPARARRRSPSRVSRREARKELVCDRP